MTRLGSLTMVSTRNIEFSKQQVELKRGVYGKSREFVVLGIWRFGKASMETAIDDAIARAGAGEYLKNVSINKYYWYFIVFRIRGIKVNGDLMGYQGQTLPVVPSKDRPSVFPRK